MENQFWDVNMRYCCSNSNKSPQVLDWHWDDDVIAYGSHNTLHILKRSNGCYFNAQVLIGHKSRVNCVKWMNFSNPSSMINDDNFLVSGSASGELKVWRGKVKLECVQSMSIGGDSINSITARMTSSSALIASSAASNVIIFKRNLEVENEEFKEFHRINLGYNYILGLDISYILVEFATEPVSTLLGGENTLEKKSRFYPILACGSDNGKVLLFGLDDKVVTLCELSGHEDWVRSVEFCGTAGELYLASASQDSYVRIWRISPKIELEETKVLRLKEIIFEIPSLSGSQSYCIQLETVLQGHDDWCYSVAWSPLNPSESPKIAPCLQLLTASMDRTVAVWSPSGPGGVWVESMRAGEVGGNTLGLYGARFGPGGVKIVAHGYQGAIHLWERAPEGGRWEGRCVVGGHFGPVIDMTWSPSGSYLLSVSSDQTARLWCEWGGTWHEVARTQIHGYDLVRCCALSDTMYVSAADEKVVRVFRSPLNFIQNFKQLTGISLSAPQDVPLGANVPALGLSNKAVFEVQENAETQKTGAFEDFKNAPQFTPRLLSAPPVEDTLLQHTLWPELRKLYGHAFELFALAASQDATLLASACKASKPEHAGVILWSVDTWTQLQTLHYHTLTVSKLAFSNNSNRLLAVSRDRAWSLWRRDGMQFNLESHSKLSDTKHSRIIWDCSWTMDDKYFVTGSRDKKLIVWGEHNSRWECACTEPLTLDDAITAVEFCQYTKRQYFLAAGLENGNVLIVTWNVADKKLSAVKCFDECHVGMVSCIAWRPRGSKGMLADTYQVATSSTDHSVRIYEVANSSMLPAAK